jgi:hypothetical protein
MQSEHEITWQFQNDPDCKCSVLRTSHTYQSREDLKSFLAHDPALVVLKMASPQQKSWCILFDEESYACETSHKSSVFLTNGCCWFYAGLQIVVGFIFFYHKYCTLQWGHTGLYFPISLTL